MKNAQTKMAATTAALLLAMLLGTLLAGGLQRNQAEFDIGAAYTAEDAAAAEADYLAQDTNQNLIALLKALCYQYKRTGNESLAPKIRQYGQMLLNRAKNEEIDLQQADDENVMLQLLSVVRETGAS